MSFSGREVDRRLAAGKHAGEWFRQTIPQRVEIGGARLYFLWGL